MNANHLADTRDAIILLGKEFEFASGIRALAADHIFREKGIDDPDELFDACEELIGSASLFESYDDALNTRSSYWARAAPSSPSTPTSSWRRCTAPTG